MKDFIKNYSVDFLAGIVVGLIGGIFLTTFATLILK